MYHTMHRTMSIIAAVLFLGTFVIHQASGGTLLQACCDAPAARCRQVCCPQCKLTVSLEKVKKHCYGVECKTICIPRFSFPWQLDRGHQGCDGGCDSARGGSRARCPRPCKGAKVKTVRVLKKYEYECQRCKYQWTPPATECGHANGCGCALGAGCDK